MKTNIKALAAIAFAALTLSLTSCSKDPEDLIIGTWNVESMTITNGSNTRTVNYGTDQFITFTFNKDKSGTSVSTYNNRTYTSEFTYTVSDNQLIVTEKGENHPQTLTIDEISKKEATLSATTTDEDEEDGKTVTIKETMKLKKA